MENCLVQSFHSGLAGLWFSWFTPDSAVSVYTQCRVSYIMSAILVIRSVIAVMNVYETA